MYNLLQQSVEIKRGTVLAEESQKEMKTENCTEEAPRKRWSGVVQRVEAYK